MAGLSDIDKGFNEPIQLKRGLSSVDEAPINNTIRSEVLQRGIGTVDQPKPSQRNFFENIKESANRGWEGTTIDLDSYQALIGRKDYKEVKERKDSYMAKISADPITDPNILKKGVYSVAGMLPAMGAGLAEGKATGVAFGAGALVLGQIGPQAGVPEELITVPGAYATGNLIGSFQFWYRQGAGALYSDLKDEEISDDVAKPIAHIGGALYGAIEFSQVDKFIPGSKLAAKKAITSSVKKAVFKMVVKYGANWIQEVGEEGVQEMVLSVSKDIASNVEGKTNKAVGAIVYKALSDGWMATKASALPMMMLMGPGAAIETRRTMKGQGISEQSIPGKSMEEQAADKAEFAPEEDIPITKSVKLEHYSQKDIGVIDPKKQYTGMAGEEARTKQYIPYAENESYYYHEGQEPEARFVGLPKYNVNFTGKVLKVGSGKYNKLVEKGRKFALSEGESELDVTAVEEATKKFAKEWFPNC